MRHTNLNEPVVCRNIKSLCCDWWLACRSMWKVSCESAFLPGFLFILCIWYLFFYLMSYHWRFNHHGSPHCSVCIHTSFSAFPFFFYCLHLASSCPPTTPPPSPDPVYCSRASAVIKTEHALGARHATLPVLQHWYSDTDRHQTVNNRQGLGTEGGWRCRGKLAYFSS